MSDDGMELLLGGAPAAKFPEIGAVIAGKVLAQRKQQSKDFESGQLKTFEDGSPMMEIVFTLQTDVIDPEIEEDDGTRRLFARGQMLKAIGAALRKAHWSAPLVGGTLKVKYAKDGDRVGRKNPPKLYQAIFEPPAAADEFDAMAGYEPDDEPF